MINFPVLCMDNFYNNPDEVREFALQQEYFPSSGHYPGYRSKLLHEINPELFDVFGRKLFSIYYPNHNINWSIQTSFWKVSTLDPDPMSPKNMGWIHEDGCLLAGVVYLTPGFDKRLGTTIYRQVKDKTMQQGIIMHKFYKDGIDEGFDEAILRNNSVFEETMVICNNYNRMICFDGNVSHGPSGYYMGNEERLVQVFFVKEIDTEGYPPVKRVKMID